MAVDYSLYLVTDSTPAILGRKDLVRVVEDAIKGGVTIVQYRDKHSDTAILIETGKKLLRVTKKANIPLLINDRVDVALAVGANGVHLGQDDMDLATARTLLGPDSIIGVSCSTVNEAMAAVIGEATYVGIGTIFATKTKENTKQIIGTHGTKAILNAISSLRSDFPAVAIGGIHHANVEQVMFQSRGVSKPLNGIAVVSCLVAAADVLDAATRLRALIDKPPKYALISCAKYGSERAILTQVGKVLQQMKEANPVCHNMTNLVVQNFAANVALAVGGSPIMSNSGAEAEDIARFGGSLVINMGSVDPMAIQNYLEALRAYNAAGNPVLLDPVGAGASRLRKEALQSLMAGGYFHVIKGNESEIKQVWKDSESQQKGVDSGPSFDTEENLRNIVCNIARREQTVVLMTGKTDILSDGYQTILVRNGHALLGKVTGSGCTLGTTIACCLACGKKERLISVLAGLLLFTIAAEEVGANNTLVRGPGTFVTAFIDALSSFMEKSAHDDMDWLFSKARMQIYSNNSP
ncbi:hypothetical protein MMC25_005414 [Agyrium rufum]|nr:hypothetical protein [Agyrium rufum]